MAVTSLSLLDRVRGAGRPADWVQFHSVYRPLIRRWVERVPGLGGEADDVVQNVWLVVVKRCRTSSANARGRSARGSAK